MKTVKFIYMDNYRLLAIEYRVLVFAEFFHMEQSVIVSHCELFVHSCMCLAVVVYVFPYCRPSLGHTPVFPLYPLITAKVGTYHKVILS